MVANGISKLDLKRQNRMQILRLLRSNGPTSRIDIARDMALTKAAVTIITSDMIEQGILYEKGEQMPKAAKLSRGRKKILLDINPTYKMDMGFVLEGDSLHMGVCTLRGEPVEKHTLPVPAEGTAEDILALAERLYRELLYKNDLAPAQITGMGVCIAPGYRETFGLEPEGSDWTPLEERLSAFVELPMTFGSVEEGAAMAECDYWRPQGESSCEELLIFRCGERLTCAAMLGGKIYRGVHGRAASMPEGTRRSALLEQCRRVFSQEETPDLWIAVAGNPARILPELLHPGEALTDPPILAALADFLQGRLAAIQGAVRLWDPGRVVLLAGSQGADALLDELEAAVSESLTSQGYGVLRSRIADSDRFLAGAALATREFFLNRGGF